MATVTKTYKECDRAGCRNRAGVEEYELSLTKLAGDPISGIFSAKGELCPVHIQRFMDNLFKNTKEYPEAEPTE